jgi:heme-degrading monooxygenase HmoA
LPFDFGLPVAPVAAYRPNMETNRTGQVAVIFRSVRTGDDETGYCAAAAQMEALAAAQPGFAGLLSARSPGGDGITVSYWTDEASAKSWRDHPDHARIREIGRARWYSEYCLDVTTVTRSYDWSRDGG